MKIVICGMSGFVGAALYDFLSAHHHDILSLSIRSNTTLESIVKTLEGSDVVINLAGANIIGRWSTAYKKVLRSSRLETTASLTHALTHCANPPHTLVNASAVGVYDSYHQHDEHSRHLGNDFWLLWSKTGRKRHWRQKFWEHVCALCVLGLCMETGRCDGENASAI